MGNRPQNNSAEGHDNTERTPILRRGAFNENICPRCRLFSAPNESEISRYGADLRGICRDRISGTTALTCDIRDLSGYGAAKEGERCQIARGKQLPQRKRNPPPAGASFGKPRFVDLEHGVYHPRSCPKCPRFRSPTQEEVAKHGPGLKGICQAATRHMPVRYLINNMREMSREAAVREKHRCWNIRHSEKVRAKGRDFYRMHRSEWLERHKAWQKTSGWKGRSISPKLRFEVLQRDGFRCVYCGRTAAELALEVDHVVSVADGGKTEKGNLVSACWECNAGKKTLQAEIQDINSGGL